MNKLQNTLLEGILIGTLAVTTAGCLQVKHDKNPILRAEVTNISPPINHGMINESYIEAQNGKTTYSIPMISLTEKGSTSWIEKGDSITLINTTRGYRILGVYYQKPQ